jgi:four helix bundle protein
MDLARDCYFLTKGFPKEELYGLSSQIRRAAVSIPANIAEGTGRTTRRDFANFLRIGQGSLRELETHLLLTVEVELVSPETVQPLLQQVGSVARLLNRLIQSMEKPVT